MSVNSVVLSGRLGKDPESRTLPNGTAVCSFSLAVNTGYGENKKTSWVPIVAFDKTGEVAGASLRKGSHVAITGRLQIRQYTNKENVEIKTTEIIANSIEFLDPKTTSKEDDNPFG